MLTLHFLNNIYNSFLQQDAPPTSSPIQRNIWSAEATSICNEAGGQDKETASHDE